MMPLIEQVLDKYPDSVKVVFKNFPLSIHKQAFPAALAAMAAADQGRFWEYHDELFLNQNSLSNEKYLEIAQQLNMDLKKFSLDVMRPSLRQKVEMDIAEGQKAGITGTPTLYVNGRKVKKRDIETLSKLIDEELAATEK